MDVDTVMLVAREALQVGMYLAAPVLLTALALGLLIGMLQAATQVQEMTLSFIPKLIGMAVAIFAAGPWMINLLVDFTDRLYRGIPAFIG